MEIEEKAKLISMLLFAVSIILAVILYFVFHILFIFIIFIPPVIYHFLKKREDHGQNVSD